MRKRYPFTGTRQESGSENENMLIIGERINTSRRPIAEAAKKFDSDFIIQEARAQFEAGADFLDVNAGTFAEKEREYLTWLVKTIRAEIDAPLCIDSSDPAVVREALQICGKGMMVNSISAESENYAAMLPLIKEYDCKTIALCLGDGAIPTELVEKLRIGFDLVDKLLSDGVPVDNIYVDPLIMTASTNPESAQIALAIIEEIHEKYPGIHTICGLSNISFGLPVRKLLNRTFLVMAMTAGLDAVILDPLDKQMMANLIATDTLLGRDDYCADYIAAYRENRLNR